MTEAIVRGSHALIGTQDEHRSRTEITEHVVDNVLDYVELESFFIDELNGLDIAGLIELSEDDDVIGAGNRLARALRVWALGLDANYGL